MPKPTPVTAVGPQAQTSPPPAATPAAALTQMMPEAMARQNSIAPLLVSLAAILTRPDALPEPVLRAALQVLGQRVLLSSSGPTAQMLETAIAKSGVYLEAVLSKGAVPSADLKSGLVALKGALASWLGGNPAPVTQAQQVTPPLRGMPPRVEAVDLPPLPDAPREVARALHSQADAALSRVKLMQLASLPDADLVRAAPQELRTEVPFLIGQELVMAQFQVLRDGARRKSEGKRGWTMRFAMNFAAGGEVGAEIGLLGRSVNVALWAADPDTAAGLEAALPELAPALAALGLEPGAVRVRSLPPDTPKPASGQYLDSRR
ncbi:MAG: flagellar hook-length control protein FliK [Devosia sp.]